MTCVHFSCRFLLLVTLCLILSCTDDDRDALDIEFAIPRTEAFADKLSAYGLYQGDMAALKPAEDVHLYEISSTLFTDYAKKQRLLKLPSGQRAIVFNGNTASYPDGTMVAKTFMYPKDFRDASLGRRIIETRLMIKAQGIWNVATYIWDETQTDAELSLEGASTSVTWVDDDGQKRSTTYEIPGEVACVTCHQDLGDVALLGLTPRDLNRSVDRNAQQINQLTYLASRKVFETIDPSSVSTVIDYTDSSQSQERRQSLLGYELQPLPSA